MVMRTPVLSGRRESIGGICEIIDVWRFSWLEIGEPIYAATAVDVIETRCGDSVEVH
jgi:hypothetical protein